MYSTEDYMRMAEHPNIILYGVKGIPYKMEMQNIIRPSVHEVRKICRDGCKGVVTFTDVFTFTMPFVDDIYKAELYYEDVLVGMRMFPPIFMMMNDGLTLTFNLQILSTEEGIFV